MHIRAHLKSWLLSNVKAIPTMSPHTLLSCATNCANLTVLVASMTVLLIVPVTLALVFRPQFVDLPFRSVCQNRTPGSPKVVWPVSIPYCCATPMFMVVPFCEQTILLMLFCLREPHYHNIQLHDLGYLDRAFS